MPGAPVALNQRDRAGRSPGAGCVDLRRLAGLLPGVEDRVDPFPCHVEGPLGGVTFESLIDNKIYGVIELYQFVLLILHAIFF